MPEVTSQWNSWVQTMSHQLSLNNVAPLVYKMDQVVGYKLCVINCSNQPNCDFMHSAASNQNQEKSRRTRTEPEPNLIVLKQ